MGRWLWSQGTHCVASTCEDCKSHHWTRQSTAGSSLREMESAGGRATVLSVSPCPKFSESQLEDPADEESAQRLVPGS